MTPGSARAGGWSLPLRITLAAGLLLAVAVRAVLLPTAGLSGDLDQFVRWVHALVTAPFGHAYDQNLSFGPVMVYVWGALAAIEPALRTVTDSSDPAIRTLMKLPASAADIGLAVGVAYALRSRPGWAVTAALAIALHPAIIDVSAWWGQYESIYVVAGLVAYLLAVSGRPAWAAVALAVALMTKPQALPFAVPFAAWYLARYGVAGSVRHGFVAAATAVILWLPFVAAGGPLAYARHLGEYQNEVFAVLSLRAWNPWWLVQEAFGRGNFIADSAAIAGPVTLRLVGFAGAAILEALVFLAVFRAPTPRRLALGLAAATLVAFTALTTMHERYAFGALVFLALVLPDSRVRLLWLAFGAVFTINLLAAAPPSPTIAQVLPIFGPLGVVGSLTMIAVTAASLWLLFADRGSGWPAAEPSGQPAAEGNGVPAEVVG